MIEKVVSGGQTGVDRAALDAALDAGVVCGGWCPRGRRAEDGVIPERYPLDETPGPSYMERTRRNVEQSDGTLVLAPGAPVGGTSATLAHARRIGKPVLVVDLAAPGAEPGAEPGADGIADGIADWIEARRIRVLNVAGPRAGGRPGVYDDARAVIDRLLAGAAIRRQS